MHNPPLPSRRALLGAAFTLLATTGAGMAEAQDPRQPKLPPIRTPDPRIEDGSILVDGRRLPYRRAGTGPAVVLVQAASPAADAKWAELLHRLGKRFTAVHVTTGALAEAGGGGADGSATGSAKALLALAQALKLERPFLVGSGAGAVVAYAVGRDAPTAVRGVMLLDTLVPGIAPWKAAAQGEPWSVDASLNAAHRMASETPLVLAFGLQSPHAAQIANHAVALREHGWSRIDTALLRMAGREVVVDAVGQVATLVEQHAQ